ncbi:hypothetical protein VNO80_13046 [Phaseolus coccineus]|uniref:Uncharacterized protein n=1 Tax=Phaseolus coccineus TaxID=3886 RepID=A0AAN9RFB5_PHACN
MAKAGMRGEGSIPAERKEYRCHVRPISMEKFQRFLLDPIELRNGNHRQTKKWFQIKKGLRWPNGGKLIPNSCTPSRAIQKLKDFPFTN